MKYGMIQPRYGRYGICGWDVMIVGMENLLFRTKKLAKEWMAGHGYDVIAS